MKEFFDLAHRFRSTPIVDDDFPEIRHKFDRALGRFRGSMPKIVCLLGSTRFKDEYAKVNREETLKGNIVLSVGFFGHVDGDPSTEDIKMNLDELHKRKIDLADEVLVINVGGYIGGSTSSEIDYARQHGKPVRWLEQVSYTMVKYDNDIPRAAENTDCDVAPLKHQAEL